MEKVVKAAILVDFFSFNKVAGRKSPVILTCGFLPLYFMAVTQVSALEPAAIDAGPFKLVPTLGVQTGHDDNIFLTDSGETDSWITVINPQVKLMAQDGPSSYSITYDLNHGKYHDSSPDDYTDHNLRGDINLELNDKNFLDVEVAYTKNHEPRGTGANQGEDATANAKPVKYDERIFDVTYTYGSREATGRLKLAGGVLDKEYTNFETQNAGRDRSTSYLGGTFYYRVAPKTQALFEVTRKRIDYDLATSPLDSTEMY
jgi:hypothetical protein